MEQIASQIIDPVVKILTEYITKHLGYATCSTKHVHNMSNKMKVLEGKTTDVINRMNRNKINDKEIPARVEGWLKDVNDVKQEVEGISSDGIGCLNIKMRYRAGRKAFEANERVKELIDEENAGFKWTDAPMPTGIVNPNPASFTASTPSSSLGGDMFRSRDKPFNDALNFLQQDDNESRVIALCGMGGIGKTTMMKQLIADENVKKLFHCFVNVAIGRDPNMHSIQNDIALCLGGEGLREATKTSRADGLYRRFKKRLEDKEKILVILDDVWDKVNLQDVGLITPLPEGVKLLLTSRDSNICKQIAADARSALQEVRVDVLEEEEAKNFFYRITEVPEDDHDKYLIGCDIVKQCGCLPLAIKVIASTLKSQEVYVWSDTLNRLKNKDLDDTVKETIKISYEHIKDEEKDIFLHCGLFPEDANIPIEDLTRHAWGLKLLKKVSTLEEARHRTYTCVNNLINASLLMNGDHVGCVKMHDIVLAFVLGVVSKGDYGWIINHGDVSKWDAEAIGESCRSVSLTCKGLKQFPTDSKYPNLSLLQLMHGDVSFTFPEDFYENMKYLKVIAYYEMEYPLLPRSLECSSNLKTLCLHECRVIFDDCSFIGDLVNLEVLSFAHCGIRKLPSTIVNLRKLKLLDLTGCVDLRIDEGVFRNLENLEELYMRVSDSKAVRFTNANFEELKMLSSQLCALEVEFVEKNTWPENFSFKKLDKFKISIGCLLEEEDNNEKYSLTKTLKLVTECSSELLACKINEMFTKTEKLYLQVNDMTGLEAVSIHPYNQHSFSSLRDLEVSKCAQLKYLFPICVASGLKKLERLTISSCPVLEALVQNDGSEIHSADEIIKFEKLKFLSLKELPKLVRLFLIDNVVELPQLVRLELDRLPNFSSIYPDKNNISALLNSQVRVSELKELSIIYMENLKQIWGVSNEEDANNISMLREIRLDGCDSLVNLFPTNPMRLLSHLESLTVNKCNSIEVIFNIDLGYYVNGHEVEQAAAGKSSLRSVRVYDSEKVREVWRIKGGDNYNSGLLIRGFEAVESIDIKYCNRFRNVFTPTITNTRFDMSALTDVTIRHNSPTPYLNRQEVGLISKEERDDGISSVAFPSNLMNAFHYLHNLELKNFTSGAEVVFEIESNAAGSKELVTATSNQQPLLPNLKYLGLGEMQSMSHVWKCCDWNKFLIPQNQSSFHNLTTIEMYRCNRIRYLFSPLMAKLLSNLKSIDIIRCDGIEEVVSNRDDDKDEEMTASTTTFFPRLHSLSFKHLRILKRIGGGGDGAMSTTSIIHDQFKQSSHARVAPWSLWQYSKEILIYQCESLIEVFETQGIYNNSNNSGGGITSTTTDERNSGIDNTSLAIPRQDNINVSKLFNLKKLKIFHCGMLQHVFTFSTLESLRQLEELMIKHCKTMEIIVKKENDEQRKVVVFPHLKSLELINLSNLKGFFLGMNDFQWPLLEKVMIDKCPQMMVFTSGESTAPKLEYIHTSLGKHSLECGLNFHVTRVHQTSCLASSESRSLEPWSFRNLIELHMEWNPDREEVKTIIPSNELLQLQKLERIRIYKCGYEEEVFDEPQSVVEIPNLTQVELIGPMSLKYIWKSSNHHVLEFPNLTTLSIRGCYKLKHVFISSMVGSLQQLQDLHISFCENLEVIIVNEEQKEEESEIECDEKLTKIVNLPHLKSLKLVALKNLKGFCLGKYDFSFPSLRTLEIIECPKITVFTKGHVDTPALSVVDTSFGRCYIRAEEDINSFIKSKQDEGFSLG